MKTRAKKPSGLSKLVIVSILGGIALVIFSIVVIVVSSQSTPPPKKITLKLWGAWDTTEDLQTIISSYEAQHPYIAIQYTKLRYEEYEQSLINGWATDSGPDIYAIANSWVGQYSQKFITAMPKSTKVANYTTKKILFKTETQIQYATTTGWLPKDIKSQMVDVVYDDTIIDNKVMALPLGLNTLVMYYNRDLLNQAHLVEPPKTWSDFTEAVKKLTVIDDQNNVVRAGTALGTYDNVPRAVDIVALLMMQNNATMVSGEKITFAQASSDPTYFPGAEAMRFFTDFAQTGKNVYTWNDKMTNALDYFAEGKLAFFFGYKYQESEIKSKSHGVDYAIAAVPQVNPSNEINYANYWVYTVAKKSQYANEAWNFLQYAANAKRVKAYLTATNQTSALRSVLNEQLKDESTATLAQTALTAKSWYHGNNPANAETYFAEMIKSASANPDSIKQAVTTAAQKIELEYTSP